jgi:hypothetical protein
MWNSGMINATSRLKRVWRARSTSLTALERARSILTEAVVTPVKVIFSSNNVEIGGFKSSGATTPVQRKHYSLGERIAVI